MSDHENQSEGENLEAEPLMNEEEMTMITNLLSNLVDGLQTKKNEEQEEESDAETLEPSCLSIDDQVKSAANFADQLNNLSLQPIKTGDYLTFSAKAMLMLELVQEPELCQVLNMKEGVSGTDLDGNSENVTIFNMILAFLNNDTYFEVLASSVWFQECMIVGKEAMTKEKKRLYYAMESISTETQPYSDGDLVEWKPNGKIHEMPPFGVPMFIISVFEEPIELAPPASPLHTLLELDLLVSYCVSINGEEKVQTSLVPSTHVMKFQYK
jgi:hypothetical protein